MRPHNVPAFVVVLASCGRIGFDPPPGGAPGPDARSDAVDAAPLGPFGAPQRIVELSSASNDEEPSFAADRLEVYFRRGTSPNGDLYVARRAAMSDPWGAPAPVTEINTAYHEGNPAISADGLTLWFASDRPGGAGDLDLWLTTRVDRASAWSPPVNATGVNSAATEVTPAVSADGSILTFVRAPGGASFDIFAATRVTATTWNSPQPIAELNTVDNESAARMWSGRTATVFDSDRPGTGSFDLWVATRSTPAAPFTDRHELVEVNTSAYEWDPWISEDGRYLMFVSDRSGNFEIYEASR